jgi:hypothetical protein
MTLGLSAGSRIAPRLSAPMEEVGILVWEGLTASLGTRGLSMTFQPDSPFSFHF